MVTVRTADGLVVSQTARAADPSKKGGGGGGSGTEAPPEACAPAWVTVRMPRRETVTAVSASAVHPFTLIFTEVPPLAACFRATGSSQYH